MPELKNVTLTWPQLQKLEKYIAALRDISECPFGELRDKDGNLCIEFSEAEVKFNLPG